MILDFLGKLLFLFSGSTDPETVKRRQLKQLAREITVNRYGRFYHPKSRELSGAMGKFFYEIYKIAAPAQLFLRNAVKSALLKQIVVEAFLDQDLEAVKERLTEASIAERARSLEPRELARSLDEDMIAFAAAFDSRRVAAIDRCYNQILSMTRFVTFDFFALLKKFDHGIIERNFTRPPRFGNVPGTGLAAELEDFLESLVEMDPASDWQTILKILQTYRNGADVVNFEQWNRLQVLLRDVRVSGILELMIRHIEDKPSWRLRSKPLTVSIAEKYLETKQAELRAALDTVHRAQTRARREELVNAVFGGTEISGAQYYTEAAGEVYRAKKLGGFRYAEAIHYLLAFLQQVFRPGFHDLCDLLLIRGKWVHQEISRETSEQVHLLTALADKAAAFDAAFAEQGRYGFRLKVSLPKTERDQTHFALVTTLLAEADAEALALINAALKSIGMIGKNLAAIQDGRQIPSRNLIMNWQELENVSIVPLGQRITGACATINAFISLTQFLVQ
jgi:hypothetical protein